MGLASQASIMGELQVNETPVSKKVDGIPENDTSGCHLVSRDTLTHVYACICTYMCTYSLIMVEDSWEGHTSFTGSAFSLPSTDKGMKGTQVWVTLNTFIIKVNCYKMILHGSWKHLWLTMVTFKILGDLHYLGQHSLSKVLRTTSASESFSGYLHRLEGLSIPDLEV